MKEEVAGSIITNPFTVDINKLEGQYVDDAFLKATFKDPKSIKNLSYILKDIMSGDGSAARREEYAYLNFEQIKAAITWLLSNGLDDVTKQLLLEKPYLLTFKDRPPTPTEMLTDKYIGVMNESIWEPVRKSFIEYFDPLKPYRTAALNPSIGAGKAQPLDTKIKDSPTSWFYMKDAVIGKEVLTPWGYSPIIAIHPQGIKAAYRVVTSDGLETECCEDHLWYITYKSDDFNELHSKIWETISTKEIIDIMKTQRVKIPIYHKTRGSTYIKDTFIESIEYSRDVEQQCITIADPRGLYILENGIVTHNSTFTMLALLYVAVHYALMRDPWKFFSMAKSSVFVFVLCAVTQGKASEIYSEPLRQMIESSTYWKYCRTGRDMTLEDKHLMDSDTVEYVPYTFAAESSVLKTGNNLNWKQISSAGSLLGMNILMGAMTEITFFLEAGKGWDPTKLMQFFSKLRQRISNRFQNNYYARFILDSSPSTLEDPIQAWMTYDAIKNSENFVWKGSRWNLYPEEFPDFCTIEKKGEPDEKVTEIHNYDLAFKLYKGGNGKPPAICETETEAAIFEEADTIWCPIKQVTKKGVANFLDKAKENPIEFMKDFAGIPAGQADRIFYKKEWIDNSFNNGLKNVYGSIVALADDEPEHLIWNQVYHLFFNKILERWYYYYEPDTPRVISVDQSKSKDCTCIAMSHIERDPTRIDEHTGQSLIVYITDFTIVLVPKGGLINLDAIKFFIWDLRRLGGVNIRHVSFDGYQSEPTKQFLKRLNFTVDWISVDANNDPYFTYIDLVMHNRWFCGKNIFVKNNMLSLYQARRKNSGSMKIEHFPGDLNYDWQTGEWDSCTAGINAKDTTDAIAGNIQILNTYINEFVPNKVWNPNDCFQRSYDNVKEKQQKNVMDSLHLF